MKKLLFVLGVLALATVAVRSAVTSDVNGTAEAKIIAPVTLSHVNNAKLNFGIIVSPETAGTRTVSTAGAATPGGGVSAYGNGDGVSADEFTLSGVGSGESYTVNLPASATITSGDNSMTVSSFTHDAAGTGTGSDITFHIGGTLQVGAHQPAGVYSGTYAVSVTY